MNTKVWKVHICLCLVFF